jgi:hypothetical protein
MITINPLTISRSLACAVALTLLPPADAQQGGVIEDKGGLSVESADGNFTFKNLWHIQADAAFYENWGIKIELDSADEVLALADVYLQYLGFESIAITAGTSSSRSHSTTSPAPTTSPYGARADAWHLHFSQSAHWRGPRLWRR